MIVSGQLAASQQYALACEGLCLPGTNNPVNACGGLGFPSVCLCQLDVPEACADAQLGCVGDLIRLCHEGQVVSGECPNCSPMGDYCTCTL